MSFAYSFLELEYNVQNAKWKRPKTVLLTEIYAVLFGNWETESNFMNAMEKLAFTMDVKYSRSSKNHEIEYSFSSSVAIRIYCLKKIAIYISENRV